MKIESVSKLENIECIQDQNDANISLKIILKNENNVYFFLKKLQNLFIFRPIIQR